LSGRERGPIAYWGLSLGTQFGLAFLAREEGVCAAVLGLFGAGPIVSRYAMSVRCPTLFLLQEGDELHPKASVEALFRQLASEEKQLVVSPGAHEAVPPGVVRSAVEFVTRRLV
jgi:pimeloyl-ACP methyl ester carboxylesterase